MVATLEFSERFEAAWALYPKRSGGNPKREAWQQWKLRLTEGITEDQLFTGTVRYKRYIVAKGKEKTEFVMMARTFYGKQYRFLEDWEVEQPKESAAWTNRHWDRRSQPPTDPTLGERWRVGNWK